MKPYPLASLNHFTVPVSMMVPLFLLVGCSAQLLAELSQAGHAGWADELETARSNAKGLYLTPGRQGRVYHRACVSACSPFFWLFRPLHLPELAMMSARLWPR